MAEQGEAERDGIQQIGDWASWHDEYGNPDSELNARKRAVQAHVAAIAAQCPPGPVTVVSICGGQGRELIGALENHPRRDDVRGRIVELDPDNAAFARAWAQRARLDRLEVLTGDASVSDAYAGLPPADVVVMSGVFGHIDPDDQRSVARFLRRLCRTGGCLVWTYFNAGAERINELREFFANEGFVEESFVMLDGKYGLTVAMNRFSETPDPFVAGARIFNFGSSRAQRRPQEG